MFDSINKYKSLLMTYIYDYKKDLKFTWCIHGNRHDKESLLAHLAVEAHTIEKGLTMPDKRFNFGHNKIKQILADLDYCTNHFDSEGDRFEDIVGILLEYKRWHNVNNIEITDSSITKGLNLLSNKYSYIQPVNQIYKMSREKYFSASECGFYNFAYSRHSCRNFEGTISDEALLNALKLANSTVPSTCNRQSVRVHILCGKEVLEVQKGSRGFGHLADKYILLTSKLNHWPSSSMRNAPYVDGGIYLMNLLYSLHYYKIAACTLNMYLSPNTSKRMYKTLNIPDNEVPICLIAIGIPPETFDLARSTRRKLDEIVTYHNK